MNKTQLEKLQEKYEAFPTYENAEALLNEIDRIRNLNKGAK